MPRWREEENREHERAFWPPWHAKEVNEYGMRRSPGLRVRMLYPEITYGLPGFGPSGRRRFPRLQLRGSAGFSPASLSSLSRRRAFRRKFKELKRPWPLNLLGAVSPCQTAEHRYALCGAASASSDRSRKGSATAKRSARSRWPEESRKSCSCRGRECLQEGGRWADWCGLAEPVPHLPAGECRQEQSTIFRNPSYKLPGESLGRG